VRAEKAGTSEDYEVFAFKFPELVQAGAASGFATGFVQFLDLRLHRRNGTGAEDPGSRGCPIVPVWLNEPRDPSPTMRDSLVRSPILQGVILTLGLTGIYFATAPKTSWTHDPLTYTVASWSLGSRGSLVLEDYASFLEPGAPPGVIGVVEGAIGPVNVAPPGVVLHAAPLYVLFNEPIRSATVVAPAGNTVVYPVPPIWPGALVAAFATAAACGITFLSLCRLAHQRLAIRGALVLAFATSAWAVSSQALWRHGPTMLWVAMGVLWTTPAPSWRSGVAWIPAILTRPQSVVIPAAIEGYQAIKGRRMPPLPQVLAPLAGVLCVLIYNRFVFGSWSVLGGFAKELSARGPGRDVTGWLGNMAFALAHPGRGLLSISPFLVLLVPGIPTAWRAATPWVKATAIGGTAYFCLQYYFQGYAGGDRYFGYRYPLEALVAWAPLLFLSYKHWVSESRFRKVLFAAGVLIAVGLQAYGVVNPYSQ
jgi:hypothetical protein